MSREEINATMTLHLKKDAATIKAHLDRTAQQPSESALTVGGRICVHIEDPFSSLASKREVCGKKVGKDSPSGWLCFEHDALLFQRKAPCSRCAGKREADEDGKGGVAHSPEGLPLCDRCAKLGSAVGTALAAVSPSAATAAKPAA
jgi:hypothetical protein